MLRKFTVGRIAAPSRVWIVRELSFLPMLKRLGEQACGRVKSAGPVSANCKSVYQRLFARLPSPTIPSLPRITFTAKISPVVAKSR
jgi:hypothetical protein